MDIRIIYAFGLLFLVLGFVIFYIDRESKKTNVFWAFREQVSRSCGDLFIALDVGFSERKGTFVLYLIASEPISYRKKDSSGKVSYEVQAGDMQLTIEITTGHKKKLEKYVAAFQFYCDNFNLQFKEKVIM